MLNSALHTKLPVLKQGEAIAPTKYSWLVIVVCSREVNCRAKKPKVKPMKDIFGFNLATSCICSAQVIQDTGDWVCLPRHTMESLAGQYSLFLLLSF